MCYDKKSHISTMHSRYGECNTPLYTYWYDLISAGKKCEANFRSRDIIISRPPTTPQG